MKKMVVIFGLIVLAMFVVSCAPTGEAFYRPRNREDLIPKAPPVPKSEGKKNLFSCGNGVVDGIEECDYVNGNYSNSILPSGVTCKSNGFSFGTPSCTFDCKIDTATCSNCGNYVLDPGEVCDMNVFNEEILSKFGTSEEVSISKGNINAKIVGAFCNQCKPVYNHKILCTPGYPIMGCSKNGVKIYYGSPLATNKGALLICPDSGEYDISKTWGYDYISYLGTIPGACLKGLTCKTVDGKLMTDPTVPDGSKGVCK